MQMPSRPHVAVLLACTLTLPGIADAANAQGAGEPAAAARCSSTGEQQDRHAFNGFVDALLVERNARAAFEEHAAPDLHQHNPAFGANRASTIAQWQKMLDLPGSRFTIQAVAFEGGLGTLRFRGQFVAGQPGALVVAFYRFDYGRIVENWDIFTPEG